jgi:glycosyltransferase involved in cell wall biosynthesis
VLSEYKEADIFLFPSLKEAFGHVYLEAMSHGMPLVVTDHGGGHFTASDDGSIKVPAKSEEQLIQGLAEGLCTLYGNFDLRVKMGRASYDHVLSHYSWDVIERRAVEVLDHVMRQGSLAVSSMNRKSGTYL